MQAKTPTFLIIGAGKSGTTSLNWYLSQHPQVFMCPKREPDFFAYEGADAPGAVTSWDEYLALFRDAGSARAIGDTSPSYLHVAGTAERIRHYLPEVRLVAILRHPVERLYSRYMQLVRQDDAPDVPFEAAVDPDSIWWQREDLVPEGFYARHLRPYFDAFPREAIRIYLYEEYAEDPEAVFSDICRFVGVDADFRPDLSTRLHQSGQLRSRFLNELIGSNGTLKRTLSEHFPGAYERLRHMPALVQRLNRFRSLNVRKPPLDAALRERLARAIYAEDIRALEAMLGRDLEGWLGAGTAQATRAPLPA